MRVRKRARHHELLRREAREQRRARGVQHGEGGGEVVLLEHVGRGCVERMDGGGHGDDEEQRKLDSLMKEAHRRRRGDDRKVC